MIRIAGTIAGFAIHRFGRLRVTGLEHVPAGGAVLVPNHLGWLDPIWIAAALWPRRASYMAKKELFVPGFGRLIRMLGAFPVDRDAPKPSALKIPLEILRASGLVVVFAGGTRSIEPGEIKRGAATLAVLAGCAIVPVRYSGPSRLRLRDLLRRPPVTVDFLPPVHPDPVARNQDGIRREARRLSQALESPPHGPGAESAG